MKRTTDAWGIDAGYRDWQGRWQATSEETRAALLAAMGAEGAAPPDPDSVLVVESGRRRRMPGPGVVLLETGDTRPLRSMLPTDLPPGYHFWQPDRGQPTRLIVTPGRCALPENLRTWGWTVPVYAARSRQSWGIGDLADLRRLAEWSRQLGAGLLLVNPLCAATPVLPQQPSPYLPGSRRFRNPLYLRVEEVPGAREYTLELEPLAAAGRDLNRQRRIDRDRVFQLKMRALELLWERFGQDAEFDRWQREQGEPLERFATFCALAEQHRMAWRQWPAEHQDPRSRDVALFAAYNSRRVRFHQWLQWLLDAQLGACAQRVDVMQDLPAGVDPDGADAWEWQDLLARGATFGAPPDARHGCGQDWKLLPFVPHRLRAARYEPFIQTVRAALRHAGALRLDHVLGLFRLFWIPRDGPPGAFVRYPAADLLGILALESRRAGAFIMGEDPGTLEAGAGEALAARGILSSRVLRFEEQPPFCYPQRALAAIAAHESEPRDEFARLLRDRLWPGEAREPGAARFEALAQAPSLALLATLEDALAREERSNPPANTIEGSNWSLALPRSLEEIENEQLPRRLAATLNRR